ncbi:hypothetical protein PCASD_00794 [Puccinia coronata f. sp. avenae]|uniref:Uncharacterized protein n=1 Tax=Puccinia coronata f. sp. avenae TaxID=200324 RepID=A0A2N5VPH9_9BASI|nr:hypothetical protein PCASD_00794 [Puccinia coronata f. sp. avenae]
MQTSLISLSVTITITVSVPFRVSSVSLAVAVLVWVPVSITPVTLSVSATISMTSFSSLMGARAVSSMTGTATMATNIRVLSGGSVYRFTAT